MRVTPAPFLLPVVLLAACATPAPKVTAPAPASRSLAALMGRPAETAITVLGSPTLDRREGPARQLQFARGPCVLDIYFLPPAGGGAAVAAHADARTPDGTPLAASDCLAQLERLRPASLSRPN